MELAEDQTMTEVDVALAELGTRIDEVEASIDDLRGEVTRTVMALREDITALRRMFETGEDGGR